MKYLFIIFLLLASQFTVAQRMKGFELSNTAIPLKEIKDGGPPKDGIPSIDKPDFTRASSIGLRDDARILGVEANGVAKAYPISIMNYHEIVNDDFAGSPVVVTYCPLCGSGVAFDSRIQGNKKTFGVSGLLYNSDVLIYDRESESLWSQLMMEAVAGPLLGEKLHMLPTGNTTWGEWKKEHPDTWVLTEKTGYGRNYSKNPYPGYGQSAELYFEVENTDSRFHPKETVIGIEVNGKYKAYPFSELRKLKNGTLKDQFQGQNLQVTYHSNSHSATITNSEKKTMPGLTTFWFAWFTFHPETEVFKAKQ